MNSGDGAEVKRQGRVYFDARSRTYDQGNLHPRLAQLLTEGADLLPGQQVLDIATGTGWVALEAAHRVTPEGHVTGIDLSPGMLSQARAKSAARRLDNVTFLEGDAEHLPFPAGSFDRVLCSSALVLMPDVPAALREWVRVLRPGGILAFDAPDSRAFGMTGVMAAVAAEHGLVLAYGHVAATQERCAALLRQAGLTVLSVRTQRLQDDAIPLEEALGAWERSLQHPAWYALKEFPEERRALIHAAFVDRVTRLAPDDLVPNQIDLHLAFGQKP